MFGEVTNDLDLFDSDSIGDNEEGSLWVSSLDNNGEKPFDYLVPSCAAPPPYVAADMTGSVTGGSVTGETVTGESATGESGLVVPDLCHINDDIWNAMLEAAPGTFLSVVPTATDDVGMGSPVSSNSPTSPVYTKSKISITPARRSRNRVSAKKSRDTKSDRLGFLERLVVAQGVEKVSMQTQYEYAMQQWKTVNVMRVSAETLLADALARLAVYEEAV